MSSLTVTDYWNPRQLLAYGLQPQSGATTAAIEGLDDEATYANKRFFRVTLARPGDTPSCPVYNSGSSAWLNSSGAVTPVTFVGDSSEGASSNTTDLTVEITPRTKQAVYVTELDAPTASGDWTMPAGSWTVRLLFRGATQTCYLSGCQIVYVEGWTSGSTWWWGTDGSSSTVIHTHTPSPLILLSSNGTYTMSFTTTSDQVVDRTTTQGRIVVIAYITNASATTVSTVTYRHNRNLLTPFEYARTIDLDPASMSAAAVPVTGVQVNIARDLDPQAVALQAETPSVTIPTPLTIPLDSTSVALAPQTPDVAVPAPRTVAIDPASVALAALTPGVSITGAPQTVPLNPAAVSLAAQTPGVSITATPQTVLLDPAAVTLAAQTPDVFAPAAQNLALGSTAVTLTAQVADVFAPAAQNLALSPTVVTANPQTPTVYVPAPRTILPDRVSITVAAQPRSVSIISDRLIEVPAPAAVSLKAISLTDVEAPRLAVTSETSASTVASVTVVAIPPRQRTAYGRFSAPRIKATSFARIATRASVRSSPGVRALERGAVCEGGIRGSRADSSRVARHKERVVCATADASRSRIAAADTAANALNRGGPVASLVRQGG